MRIFDENTAGDRRQDTPWKQSGDESIILEGEIVGDNIHVAPPEPERFWGGNAARLGKRLLIAAAILASIIILIPLTLAFVAVVMVLALVGRLLFGRSGSVAGWMRPPGRASR